jgi:hypothetical protein
MTLCTLVDSYGRFERPTAFSLHYMRVSLECKIKYLYSLVHGLLKGQRFFKLFLFLLIYSEPLNWLSFSFYAYDVFNGQLIVLS